MAHHKRRKRKRANNIGHCGMCQMESGKGTGKKRRDTPAEARSQAAELESVNDVAPYVDWDALAVFDAGREGAIL